MKKLLIVFLLCAWSLSAALSASTVWEVRTGGADTNGCAFVTGASGTDWSIQDAAQYAVTDGVTAGTTTITSATANFGTDVVGNLMYVTGGTGAVTADWYHITARTNATTITVDRSTGLTAGTGVTLNIGGGCASPAVFAAKPVGGNIIFIKYNATPYTITSASTNISAGCMAWPTTSFIIVGYDTTRTAVNTDANRPTLILNAGVSTSTMMSGSAGRQVAYNLILDGAAQTSSRGIASMSCARCKLQNFTNNAANTALLFDVEVTGCSTQPAVSAGSASYTYVHDNTVTAFSQANCFACVADTNTGASSVGFDTLNTVVIQNSIAYNNGSHGFQHTASRSMPVVNSIAEGNGGYGFTSAGAAQTATMGCATYNNTSGATQNMNNWGLITGSGSFFTDAAGGDFSPNNTADAGALIRTTGYPTTIRGSATTTSIDVGAAQHPAGAASVTVGIPSL